MEDYDAPGVPRESQGRDDGLRWEARTILLERMVMLLPDSVGAYWRTNTVSNCPNTESVQVEVTCLPPADNTPLQRPAVLGKGLSRQASMMAIEKRTFWSARSSSTGCNGKPSSFTCSSLSAMISTGNR